MKGPVSQLAQILFEQDTHMGTMLVDNHQSRFYRSHDILTFILIMGWRFLCNDTVWRIIPTRIIGKHHGLFHPLHIILIFESFIKLFPFFIHLRFRLRNREACSHRDCSRGRGRLERIITRIQTDLRCSSRTHLRIVNRDVRFILGIEINGRYIIEHTDRLLDRSREDLPDSLLILEFDFSLRRMDIHINILRIYIKIQKVRHLFTLRNQTVISSHHSLIEIRMFHVSPVDKEELMHTFLSGRFRFAHKSRHLTHSGFYIYRQEFLIETLAEDIENALTQISGTQIEYFGTIAM